MTTPISQVTLAFMYTPDSEVRNKDDRSGQKIRAVLNVLGYIPIIQTISGIARIALGLFLQKNTDPKKRTHGKAWIVRGSIEALLPGVGGLLLAITDVANRYRFRHLYSQNAAIV